MRARIILIALAIFTSGCERRLSKSELLAYTMDIDNGLFREQEKAGVRLGVVYRPSQLIANQELRGASLTKNQIDSVLQVFQQTDYFLLRLSYNSHEIENRFVGDVSKFNEINNYLSFEIGTDVYLIQDGDTLRSIDFIRTRTLGSSPSTDVLFAFKPGLDHNDGDAKFVFDDRNFATGVTEFDFNIDDIRNVSTFHIID